MEVFMRNRVYAVWKRMIARCLDPNDRAYSRYGGRGIGVCERWLKFSNFYSDMGDVHKGMTIERIDNEKGYEPGNCKWATWKEQANNKRTSRYLEFQGKRQTVVQWAEEMKLNCFTLYARLSTGWSVERALTTPANNNGGRRRWIPSDEQAQLPTHAPLMEKPCVSSSG
jgi:hypothetical protein